MIQIAFNALLFASCLYALLRGGGPERVCAIAFLVATLLTVLVWRPMSQRFHWTEFGVLAVDLTLLAVLIVLATLANRLWPMAMAAMQLVDVAGHAAKASPIVLPWTYATILAFWSYPMLMLLMLATYRHRQRIKKTGIERSWRRFSGLQPRESPSSGLPG